MTIDERLSVTEFPLPAIREVNLALHPTGVSLGLGELRDFTPDKKIIEALTKSLNEGGVNYCSNGGLMELREAVADAQKKEDGYSYDADNVVITIGVQNAIYATIKTLAKLGAKRVLIPEVNFGIYKKIPAEFGLEVITYKLTADHGIDTYWLSRNVSHNDILILNSPANPTGRVLSSIEMKNISDVLQNRLTSGYVISDEIYGKLIYEGENPGSFSKYFDRTIMVNGISKSGAVAGLRVGWAVTRNKALARAIVSNNASIISAPPTANQYAAIPIVRGETASTIERYNQHLKQNRDKVMAYLDELKIPYVKPTGSFYLFAGLDKVIKGDVKDFCITTAKKKNGVVVIPGIAFGDSGKVRISLAVSDIDEGMQRFVKAVKNNRQ